MAIISKMHSTLCRSIARRSLPHGSRFNAFTPAIALRTSFATTTNARQACNSSKPSKGCSQAGTAPKLLSITSADFWSSRSTWQRAGVNTLRCLVGCTLGDFSAMWYLQAFHPDLGTGAIMGISMASGISTSLLLETVLLRYGKDRLRWMVAAKTAAGMSLISMISMELAENLVDYHLTGGVIQLQSPQFWAAAVLSVAAGFLTPLPYNYHRLRRFGKACH